MTFRQLKRTHTTEPYLILIKTAHDRFTSKNKLHHGYHPYILGNTENYYRPFMLEIVV